MVRTKMSCKWCNHLFFNADGEIFCSGACRQSEEDYGKFKHQLFQNWEEKFSPEPGVRDVDPHQGKFAQSIALKIIDSFSEQNVPVDVGISALFGALVGLTKVEGWSKHTFMDLCEYSFDRWKGDDK